MDIKQIFTCDPEEKPLDLIKEDGGLTSVFRTIAVVGDSLSSGELEARDHGSPTTYHDYFDISWGQYLARMSGTKVYNFSRGGMTASEYCNGWADANGLWNHDKDAQAYIIALGCNDIFGLKQEIGSLDDIKADWHENNPTFCGYMARIIARYKEQQPDAVFFLVTMPRYEDPMADDPESAGKRAQRDLMYRLAEHFSNTYVIDLWQYGPEYDKEFRENFFTGGHLNTMGYYLTAKMIGSYIDYIVRHNVKKFNQCGFIGTPFRYTE